MIEPNTPILVGCGQVTLRDESSDSQITALELIKRAAILAAADTGLDLQLFNHVDALACVQCTRPGIHSLAGNLADDLGLKENAKIYYSTIGGNTPQWFVNTFAEKIARGQLSVVLLAGGEKLSSLKGGFAGMAQQSNVNIEPSKRNIEVIGDHRSGSNQHEVSHGLMMPTQVYPLFENALRNHYGHSVQSHRDKLGELYSYFSQVAADNDYAWFRKPLSAAEIVTVSHTNRYISYPYTKFMNAMIAVNQSASLVMMSVASAEKLGIDPSLWVYIHGMADTHDHWYPSERQNYYSSPAIGLAGKKALAMAEKQIEDMNFIDLYSCFPCAVQIARDELGIAESDRRHLTVTGGLRFHGGPGNNYTMHSIATMMDLVRRTPRTWGLVTGLGWHLTKHSIGVYSAEAFHGPWHRQDPVEYQSEIDVQHRPELVLFPRGKGKVETYTVAFNGNGEPEKGVIIGRLDGDRRFIANTPVDAKLFDVLINEDIIGWQGKVRQQGETNLFEIEL